MSSADDSVQAWLARAEDDLRIAALTLTAKPAAHWIVGSHAQQAAEKFMKGFPTFHAVEFEKSHDIRHLAELCADSDPWFESLRPVAGKLTAYAVETRYPYPHRDPTETEAMEAIEIARQVRGVVHRLLPARFSPGG